MHFFKYLFLLFLSLYSASSYSADSYYLETQPSFRSGSMQSTCSQLATHLHETLGGGSVMYSLESSSATSHLKFDFACVIRRYVYDNYSTQNWYGYKEQQQFKCSEANNPIPLFFQYGDDIPTRVCRENPDGTFCIAQWTPVGSKTRVIDYPSNRSIILSSVSSIPSSSCTPSFDQGDKCNPKDPYGGCFVPADDGCSRKSDGSISCPPDEPPPLVEPGCKDGAIYCDRPPQGCGKDHVSGKLNGKLICVAKSNSASNNNDHTSSPTTLTSSNSDGSNTSVSKNANGDVTGLSVANNDGSTTTTTVSNPSSNGSSSSTTITKNADGTTSKQDSTTTVTNTDGKTTTTVTNSDGSSYSVVTDNLTGKTTTTNKNGSSTQGNSKESKDNDQSTSSILKSLTDFKNELLTSLSELKDAISGSNSGGGDGGGDGGGGSCTDTEVNGVFCELSNWFQEEVPESESVDAPVSELNQQSLDSGIFSSNAQCPSDVTLDMPIGGRNFTYTFSFSIWCEWLGVFGSFILIAAYCFGAYIVVSKS